MGISVGQLLPDHRNDRQHGRAVLLGSLSGCSRFGVLFDSPHSVLFVVPPVLELPLPGQLKKAWVEDPGCFRHPVPSLARTDLLDTCKTLIGVRAMMKKIVDECATAKLPEFSKVSMKFLEPKMVEDKLHWVTDAYLGKSSSEVDVLENLKQWLELRHLGVMYAVTATQDDINNQWSDSRVQNIVSAPLQKTLGLNGCLLQAWACFLAVLMDFLADGSQGSVRSTRRRCRRQCQTEGAAVQATAADSEWDKEPDPKMPERPRRQSLEGKDSILDKAKVEIQRYTKFCICDISDAASMEAALQGMLGCSDSSAAACTHKNLKPG